MDAFPQDPSAAAFAPAPPKPPFWRFFATRRFLFISIAVHLLFGVGASLFYVQTVTARKKANFVGAPPSTNPSTRAMEHKVQMAQKQKTMSAPAQMRRITTTAVNTKVALPQMPAMPTMTNSISPMKMAGMGGNGMGLSMGGGAGSGGGTGGGPVSLFGLRSSGGGTLVGTFYDFKQTPDGKPTPMTGGERDTPAEAAANPENMKFVGRFANGGFSESSLSNFFKGPAPLYATQIFIPVIRADDGPKEFNLADKVKPRRWIVVYRASVTPPESGRYRFVGLADDYLIVRFRHQIVLDGSLHYPTQKKPAKQYELDGMTGQWKKANVGDTFDVSAGDHYDIEILIGEQPGGEFEAFLLLEKDGADYTKDSKGNPILPIFRTARSTADRTGECMPVTSPDTSWSVWKADKQQL